MLVGAGDTVLGHSQVPYRTLHRFAVVELGSVVGGQ
jgi:hypothetical protein